ncbi:AAA family ATPase [Altererythrobacter sp. Root672]|uniref:AAA family ATPase n=1 Tax=Altererythrobacter sp. Root672 TaxID=1736584 RepID=UPI0006F954E7|nr:AAA family ATPase [Altererythrobacter sp. Root672]KRA79698.1 hypothetical protein ASD76_16875 [Altererythrobacter sp. Root672]
MRRVVHGTVRTPEILQSDSAVQARTEIAEFLSRPTEELASRRAPINEKLFRNDEVSQALQVLFYGKCAYCEDMKPQEVDVEQHRPPANAASARKSFPHHYSWLAYEWENLLLVCRKCQERKRSLFPLRGGRAPLLAALDQVRAQESPELLDPGYDRPERHLDFTLDGRCHPRTKRGAATIAILELNRPDLLSSRGAVFGHFAVRVRAANSPDTILSLMLDAGGSHDPFAGAMLILRNHYATAVAERIDHFTFPFDDTRGVLARLHQKADLKTLQAAFDELASPREFGVTPPSKAVAQSPGWQGFSPPIRSVTINNFRAIEELTFEMPPRRPDSSAAACLMLLGENATGKSTILEAVTLALVGAEIANTLGLKPKDYIRRLDPRHSGRDLKPARVHIEFYEGPDAELIVPINGEAFEGTPAPSANVLAYGSRRFFLKGRRRRAHSGGIRGLFDPMWVLPHPDLWLRTLEPVYQFGEVARALREVLALPDEAELLLDEETGVTIKTGDLEVSIEQHSDGYRSLFATAVDIMHGMMGAAADLSEARGVVMIDEIETHLHPRWKMRVMSALRKALPQVQFLVTTHDPLCLRGMENGEVQVMIRDDEQQIERLEELPDVRGLRAEQLLTSDFFGLASTADPEVELALAQQADRTSAEGPPPSAVSPLDKLTGAASLGDTPQEQLAAEAMDSYLKSREGGNNDQRKEARREAVSALKAILEARPASDPA